MTGLVRGSLFALLALFATAASAEPRFALQTGFRCAQCHSNPSGGGLRNVFGNAWAHTQLAQRPLEDEGLGIWTGRIIGEYLSVGGNVRYNYDWSHVRGQRNRDDFGVNEERLYAEASLIPGRLSVYVDERVAPDDNTNLEANVRLWLRGGTIYVKAGRMYLPFGWRFEDDNVLVRQLSGFNMQTPDKGVEIGYEEGPWSAQLAVTNGVGGGPGVDDGKQIAARFEYVRPRWRVGVSAGYNDPDIGKRRTGGLFGGVNLGPVGLLGELVYVDDDGIGVNGRQLLASTLEANWAVHRGHNLKVAYEWLDPDDSVAENEQTRASIVYEWTPIQFLQLRVGFRKYDGIPQSAFQNRSQGFVQVHGFF